MDSPSEDQAVFFFRTMVEPTVAEFMADPADPRRGFLACIVLAAQFEHTLAVDGPRSRNEIARMTPELKAANWPAWAMREAANAFKHVIREDPGRWSFGDFSIHDTAQAGIFRVGWPLGGMAVLVGVDKEWRLVDLVVAAADYWRQLLGIAKPQPE